MSLEIPRSTLCSCDPPIGEKTFYCSRHRCNKPDQFFVLCRTRSDFFELWEAGKGPGQQSKNSSPATVNCVHRGERPVRQVICELCGARNLLVAVYPCAIHGECTISRWGTRTAEQRDMHNCLRCADRRELHGPPESVQSEATPNSGNENVDNQFNMQNAVTNPESTFATSEIENTRS